MEFRKDVIYMKNAKEVARLSKYGGVPLYYDVKNDAVYTKNRADRYLVTFLIRENTEEEIVATVRKFMSM